MSKDAKKSKKTEGKAEKVKPTTYNLRDFAASIAEGKEGLTIGAVQEVLSEFCSSVEGTVLGNQLKTGDKVNLPGLGQFVCLQKKARKGRNPATGESLQIPARPAVKFKLSSSLRLWGKPAKEEKKSAKKTKK